ncbi:hypothetical protein PPYR_04235 [Photinus pyralis]|uniref:Pre-mRNA-splicing factor 38 n=3 Tax=Photinus pyralis TaxID=7054 RepID=A0A1Y1KD21_PHOPY|nr:pre-mRNA-splicing factor 38B [Photinus pyralis]KAB0802049.1 hypothetical protein PPYR_04235 [Photinus pyralis]
MDNNYDSPEEGEYVYKNSKLSNVLPLWGNERSMNLNPLILTNIQSSHYFKVNLYELKTYHEVIDEIYYKVTHLEPWEKGSRRTSGQTGMCGGVRGVGAGGIVSTAYCLLYKLFTLKLTRKQLNGLITHCDSPYIRALGFMYIRYTQPPTSLLDWYEPYLDDEEEMDVKAGGGQIMRLGLILRQWLMKLEWFSTLFPRIPVPIQQKIQKHLEERFPPTTNPLNAAASGPSTGNDREDRKWDRKGGRDWGKERDREWREDHTRDYLRDDRDRENSARLYERDRREKDRDRSRDERDDRRNREKSPQRGARERSPRRERHHHSNRDKEHRHRHKHR